MTSVREIASYKRPRITTPNADSQSNIMILTSALSSGGYATATRRNDVLANYDTSDAPAAGGTLGTVSGSLKLKNGNAGMTCLTAPNTGVGNCRAGFYNPAVGAKSYSFPGAYKQGDARTASVTLSTTIDDFDFSFAAGKQYVGLVSTAKIALNVLVQCSSADVYEADLGETTIAYYNAADEKLASGVLALNGYGSAGFAKTGRYHVQGVVSCLLTMTNRIDMVATKIAFTTETCGAFGSSYTVTLDQTVNSGTFTLFPIS